MGLEEREYRLLKFLKRVRYRKGSSYVMGAKLHKQQRRKSGNNNNEKEPDTQLNVEQFFRPSRRSILNRRFFGSSFFGAYSEKSYDEIKLPPSLLDTPENMILNYYSILREAENLTRQLWGGCGTVGWASDSIPDRLSFFHHRLSAENALFNLSYIL